MWSPTISITTGRCELIKRERGSSPLFTFVYTVANHFPWNTAFRADLTPQWRPLGNEPEVDEYIRRQTMSARDYAEFVERLKREFPDEPFLLVRFGDHQPSIAARIIDPALDDVGDRAADHAVRSPLFLHLLRDRRDQLQTGRRIVRA